MYSQSVKILNPFEALYKAIDEKNSSNGSISILHKTKTKTKRENTMKIKNILKAAILVIATLFIIILATGALASPIILSFNYSWYWLFLYVGYLALAIYVAVLYRMLD